MEDARMHELPADGRDLLDWLAAPDRADRPLPAIAERAIGVEAIEDSRERTRARHVLGAELVAIIVAAVRTIR
jgi:hypothetical protein